MAKRRNNKEDVETIARYKDEDREQVFAELNEKCDLFHRAPWHVNGIQCTRRYAFEQGLKVIGEVR